MGQIENKEQGARFKPNTIDNNIKCKWSYHLNKKAETASLDKKARDNYTLPTRITFEI